MGDPAEDHGDRSKAESGQNSKKQGGQHADGVPSFADRMADCSVPMQNHSGSPAIKEMIPLIRKFFHFYLSVSLAHLLRL